MVIDLSFYIDAQAPVATALSLAAGGINQAAVSVSAIIYRLVAQAVQGPADDTIHCTSLPSSSRCEQSNRGYRHRQCHYLLPCLFPVAAVVESLALLLPGALIVLLNHMISTSSGRPRFPSAPGAFVKIELRRIWFLERVSLGLLWGRVVGVVQVVFVWKPERTHGDVWRWHRNCDKCLLTNKAVAVLCNLDENLEQ
jgi:hypothetical protein